ncbi:hypothetical protein HK102_012820 [Quaeritorhiza haematococci]|nr:hypothetical protein HK102_012820 [Quaeritorhiza haematococci]
MTSTRELNRPYASLSQINGPSPPTNLSTIHASSVTSFRDDTSTSPSTSSCPPSAFNSQPTLSVKDEEKRRQDLIQGLQHTFPGRRLPIYNAAYLGAVNALSRVLNLHPEIIESSDESGCTALMKAAYKGHVGVVKELLKHKGKLEVDATDTQGHTALVWAAVGGEMECVKLLVEEGGADVNGSSVVRNTVDAGGGDNDDLKEKSDEKSTTTDETESEVAGKSPSPQSTTAQTLVSEAVTPLVSAAFRGHMNIVQYLLEKGAEINARVCVNAIGTSKKGLSGGDNGNLFLQEGKTALMVAAWMMRTEIVRYLLTHGAKVDSEASDWLKKGALFLRRSWVEQNAWRSITSMETLHHHQRTPSTGVGGSSAFGSVNNISTLASQTLQQPEAPRHHRRESLKEKLWYFTAEENEMLTQIQELIVKSMVEGKSKPGDLTKTSSNVAGTGSAVVADGVGRKDADSQKKDPTRTSTDMLASDDNLATPRARARVRRRSSGFRHGLNLEKIIGSHPEVILDLTDRLPKRGTELDLLCLTVFRCVIQLVLAANRNIKHQYIAISAKAIHHSGEIIRAVESMDKIMSPAANPAPSGLTKSPTGSNINALNNGGAAGAANNGASTAAITGGGSGTIARPSGGSAPETLVFSMNHLRVKLKDVAKNLNMDYQKQLMVTTRLAVGVWPPPNATAEMIKAASTLAKACKELVDLANIPGYFALIDKNLDLNVEPYQDQEKAKEAPALTETSSIPTININDNNPRARLNVLNYDEYKRENQLKAIEEMSRQYDRNSTVSLSRESLGVFEAYSETYTTFLSSLDNLLRQFVASVSDLKNLHDEHLKEEYLAGSSAVMASAEAIIEEARSYEPLSTECPDDIMFEVSDSILVEQQGVIMPFPQEDLPLPLKPVLRQCMEEVRTAAKIVLARGTLASGVWPPPSAAAEMLQSTIPCVIAVKKLVVVSKETAGKLQRILGEERLKKETWRKECLQNERVKKLFQMWEGQNKEEEKEDSSQSVEESALMEQSTEGLVLEENSASGKSVVIKGGRIGTLIEWMSSHAFVGTHYMAPHWTDNYFEEDFAENESLLLRFRDFVDKNITLDFPKMAASLLKILDDRLDAGYRKRKTEESVPSTPTQLSSPTNANSTLFNLLKPLNITGGNASADKDNYATLRSLLVQDPRAFLDTVDPLDMARQLTLIEFEHFRSVRPHDCLDQIWGEKRRKELVAAGGGIKKADTAEQALTGIAKMIRHTNNTKGGSLYRAQHCRELNNFNGITGIVAGLSMAPVNRLRKTWAGFADKHTKLSEAYAEVADLVSPKGQYANYRKALKELTPPAIPFLGVYLTDLTFIELGNPDFLPETHYVNFEKRRKVYELIREIQGYQLTPFPFQSVPVLNELITGLGGGNGEGGTLPGQSLMNEDDLYDLSLVYEPREEEDDDFDD